MIATATPYNAAEFAPKVNYPSTKDPSIPVRGETIFLGKNDWSVTPDFGNRPGGGNPFGY